jgi:serine/threonine protein phosphatase 1
VRLCEEDAAGLQMKFVFLGDYVDRGPDSRAVIDFLIRLQMARPGAAICLRGNHEDMMLKARLDSTGNSHWLRNGGRPTLESYNLRSVLDLPQQHCNWLQSLPMFHDDQKRFFVHAGVNPARSLDDQDDHDLLWIREPFLSSDKSYGRLIVHGHTPTKKWKPEQHENRINLDTGAVYGRALSAAVFDDERTAPNRYLAAD